jgi:hypothetical protein
VVAILFLNSQKIVTVFEVGSDSMNSLNSFDVFAGFVRTKNRSKIESLTRACPKRNETRVRETTCLSFSLDSVNYLACARMNALPEVLTTPYYIA